MKKILRGGELASWRVVLLLVVMLLMAVMLSGHSIALPRDLNNIPLDFPLKVTCFSDSIGFDTGAEYDSLKVSDIPAGSIEMTVIGRHAGLYVRIAASKASIPVDEWIYVPKEVPVTFPVADLEYPITYKSATGKNRISFIFRRL